MDNRTPTASRYRFGYEKTDECCGRLTVIKSMMDRKKFTLNVGSKEVHFNDAINIDLDPTCRPHGVADARYLPFKSEIFEQILFTDVIEHLPKGSEPIAVKEIHRVLCEGGTLILSTPHDRLLFVLLDPALYLMGHRHYTMTEITKLLEAYSFNVVMIFTSGFIWACINIIWYAFITYPVKKIFNHSLPYAPLIFQLMELKEYKVIGEKGYTVFVKAVK